MSFSRHPAYKPSGVTWIGEVPSHWKVYRFKQLFRERDERSFAGEETLLSVSAYTGVTPRSDVVGDGEHLSRADSLEGYKVCYPDDLVVNIMLAWNRGLGFSAYHGIVSPAYSVFRLVGEGEPRYLNYMVRSNEYTLYFKAFSTGVIDSRLRLYPDTFSQLYCALPPLAEQRRLADFLDRETTRIDALIVEQERLIDLLKEKRQAAISHIVTAGLNPNVTLVQSSDKWLGHLPEHWSASPLKHLASIDNSGSYGAEPEDSELALPVATTAQIDRMGRFVVDEMPVRGFSRADVARYGCREGDVLIVKSSGSATNIISGKVGLVEPTTPAFVFSNFLMRARPKSEAVIPKLLFYLLASHLTRQRVERMCSTTTYPNLDVGEYISALLPVPPIREQQAIVGFLDETLLEITELITESERGIALLLERRTALISAAVTGKINVLDFAGSAP